MGVDLRTQKKGGMTRGLSHLRDGEHPLLLRRPTPPPSPFTFPVLPLLPLFPSLFFLYLPLFYFNDSHTSHGLGFRV